MPDSTASSKEPCQSRRSSTWPFKGSPRSSASFRPGHYVPTTGSDASAWSTDKPSRAQVKPSDEDSEAQPCWRPPKGKSKRDSFSGSVSTTMGGSFTSSASLKLIRSQQDPDDPPLSPLSTVSQTSDDSQQSKSSVSPTMTDADPSAGVKEVNSGTVETAAAREERMKKWHSEHKQFSQGVSFFPEV